MTRVKKQKSKYMTRITTCILVFLFLFTVISLFLFYKTGNEPSTLITCVYSACVGELGITGLIKKTKITKGDL